ncbi:MAG TPA: ATP synthase F1 subunit delta [Candidatus Polarisedimenticolaceae bacterium]|nr:ATP synthase F1 subunit delta [Candidatus Polarisedimenticolaceae bacterium]
MKDRKLATRYARALLSALPETSEQDTADEFLSALAASIRANPAFRAYLLDPANPAPSKDLLLRGLADTHRTPKAVAGLLATVVANRRLANLESIAAVFHEERERAQGRISATVVSATPMDQELTARTRAALERLTGSRVNLTAQVDATLLGGVVTRIGSVIYDGSLKTQLARLRQSMGKE